jgi:phage terminase large subunit GpA-like protein
MKPKVKFPKEIAYRPGHPIPQNNLTPEQKKERALRLERESQYRRRWRLRFQGLCGHCGAKVPLRIKIVNRKKKRWRPFQCPKCAEYAREYMRKQRAKLKELEAEIEKLRSDLQKNAPGKTV